MPYVIVNDTRLFYRKSGHGPAIVFLHGLFSDSRTYKSFIAMLSSFYAVYALDIPGHGKSDRARGSQKFEDYSKMLNDFIKERRLRNFILMGHSAGCLIAMDYARRYPVSELVLIQPAGHSLRGTPLSFLYKLVVSKTLNDFLVNPLLTIKAVYYGIFNFIRSFSDRNFRKLFMQSISPDFRFPFNEVKAKTTLIWAKQDETLHYSQSRLFLHCIKNSKLITLHGNHDWPVFEPEMILAWLVRQDRTKKVFRRQDR